LEKLEIAPKLFAVRGLAVKDPVAPKTLGGTINAPTPALLKFPVAVPVPTVGPPIRLAVVPPKLATVEAPEPSPPADPNWLAATA
jgi:hypothetical protein